MFKPRHKLKTLLLCLTALFCAGLGTLGAQSIKVGVDSPRGDDSVNQIKTDIRNALSTALVKARGFQVIDLARTDQISQERKRQNERLTNDQVSQIEIVGAEYLLTSEITLNELGEINIKCEMIHMKTESVVGSDSTSLGEFARLTDANSNSNSKSLIANACENMMKSIVEQVYENASVGSSRTLNQSLLGKDEDDGYDDMSDEIRRTIMSNRTNTKWNSMGNNRELEVNTSGIRLNGRREHGITVYRVSGRVQIRLRDKISGNISGTTVFEVKDFSVTNRELLRHRLLEQIKSGTSNIIKDLLGGQVDEWDW